MRKMFKKFVRQEKGSMFAEIAFALPMLVMVLFGTVEMSRYVLVNMKVDRVANTMADLVSRAPQITQTDVNDYFFAVEHVLRPFKMEEDGTVIISSITGEDSTNARIQWQRQGAGTLAASSHIGQDGQLATLPGDFTLKQGENVILVEVYYNFEPFVAGDIRAATQIYRHAVFRPRINNLQVVN